MMWQALPALVAIVAAAFLPGALLLWLGGRQRVTDLVTFVFAASCLGFLFFGWVALVLAEAGWFSLLRLALVWGATVLALAGACLVSRSRVAPRSASALPGLRVDRWQVLLLAAWLLVAGGLYCRPHQTITGGADAGVYVNLGASIVHTGGILISDATLADLDPALYPALLRKLPPSEGAPYYLLPGFYVMGTPRGLVVPQFYPLHPAWLAVGYSLGGLPTELLMTPLWGMLGALSIYMTVRRLWGWKIGFLALAALSSTALQVWFARYATSEMLTQFLLWTGTWALIGWVDDEEPRWLWPTIAGTALGQVFLTRIDMYVLLAVPVAAYVWRWRTRGWRSTDAFFFGPFILLALHSLLHGVLQSRPYAAGLLYYLRAVVLPRLSWSVLPAAIMAALAVLVLFGALDRRPEMRRRLRRLPWGRLAALLVIALAFYAYFLRPGMGQPTPYANWYDGGRLISTDRENLVRLGWYLSPIGVTLGVAGIAWLLSKETNRRTAFLIGAGLFFSLFYLWRIQATPHQIYAMRRYVPVVLPFFIVAAAYAIYRVAALPRNWARWLSLGLTVIWFSGIVWSARGFVSHVDMRRAIEQVDVLSASLAPRSVLLFGDPAPVGMGDLLGTPLRFLHRHDVYTLRDLQALDKARFEEALSRWRADGRQVYWITVANGPSWPGQAVLGPTRDFVFEAVVLENAYDHKPARIDVALWHITLAPVAMQP